MILLILIVLLILALGSAPVYPYSRGYGWAPSGLLLAVLVVLLLLALLGPVRLYP